MKTQLTKKGLVAKGLVIFALVNVFLMFTYGGVLATSYFGSTINAGVKVNGILLEGLNKDEALRVLSQTFVERPNQQVTFQVGEHKYLYSYKELGIRVNLLKSVQEALDFGRKGPVQDRYKEISLARGGKVDLQLLFDIDHSVLKEKIDELAGKIDIAPEDAGLAVGNDGALQVINEQPGLKIDRQQLLEELTKAEFSGPVIIKLNPISISPKITTGQIQKMAPTETISEATTTFDPSNLTRKENLRVAANMINNKIFAPGEVISFNKVIGPRAVERGFKEANVIVNGKFVPGVGGGICQVSSTLYYSVLKANLKVVNRSNHSLKVGYLPAGLDATISGNEIDFKFQNTTPGYIMIKAQVTGAKLTIKLLGVPEAKKYEVKVISKLLATIPNNFITIPDNGLLIGQEEVVLKGQPGYKAHVTRELWQNGKLVQSETISNDNYKPQDRIVHVGIRPWE
jgi:vancomycin resistance protein YoaR